jgi:methylenetetrahydrofolate dehydrogenase (NADP+)/methenyltetrahydrofolate cyclohydrolase
MLGAWRTLVAKVIEGDSLGRMIKDRVKNETSVLRGSGINPLLATVLVGDNAASTTYLRSIHSACVDVGFQSRNLELTSNTSQHELEQTIDELNSDTTVTGILLQLPLPKSLDEAAAINKILPEKDVDGLHPFNLGQLWQKSARLVPCTPKGVIVLLKYHGIGIRGKHAVIINRTKLVGRPLAQLLLNEDATVTVCHSKTVGLKEIAREGDILFTGIGRREHFTVGADMIKSNAAVIDVGTSRVSGRLLGDVDFDSALKVAGYITPVPGGVGPMTVAMLLYNTLVATTMQRGLALPFDPEQLSAATGL